jgi:hypothetical protein
LVFGQVFGFFVVIHYKTGKADEQLNARQVALFVLRPLCFSFADTNGFKKQDKNIHAFEKASWVAHPDNSLCGLV